MFRAPLIGGRKHGTSSSDVAASARTSDRGPAATVAESTFIVKLRNPGTNSWGNETEVIAASPRQAAEQVAGGEHLLEGPGERSNLRARVWKAPHGSSPDLSFYSSAADPAAA